MIRIAAALAALLWMLAAQPGLTADLPANASAASSAGQTPASQSEARPSGTATVGFGWG